MKGRVMTFRRIAFACVLFFCVWGAFGQGTVTGQLTGTTTPGATVTVTSRQLQGPRTTTADANGEFLFVALPPGDYTVSFTGAEGERVTKKAAVTLSGV